MNDSINQTEFILAWQWETLIVVLEVTLGTHETANKFKGKLCATKNPQKHSDLSKTSQMSWDFSCFFIVSSQHSYGD